MTKLKLLSAGLIAAAVFATPAMARQHHVTQRYPAANADVGTAPDVRYIAGQACNPAPRVGAFATAPWENDTPCLPTWALAY